MKHTDEKIKKNIVDHLFWDHRVDASKILVEVDRGVVVIAGEVPSNLSRNSALEDARLVEGVTDVINKIRVKPTLGVPDDERIKKDVLRSLSSEIDLDIADIDISAQKGVVTIRGAVDALWKKYYAEDTTFQVNGVVDVKNLLTVVPTGDYLDKDISEVIVASLERNAMVNAEDITVEVKDGNVMLTGTVPNTMVRKSVYEAALYTPGVIGIEDRLEVDVM